MPDAQLDPAVPTTGPRRACILVVDDNAPGRYVTVHALRSGGHQVAEAASGAEALEQAARLQPDLMVLDVNLPDISGFELCKQVRARSDVPLMFLTARSEEIDRLIGLEIGADDYVAKPFSPREVCARVRVILRRSQPTAPKQSAALTLDEERARIHFHGQPLMLTRYEYLLLALLLERPGRILSRPQIMAAVWQDDGESLERTVDTHIKTLRGKLRAVRDDEVILTHRGLGYSLAA